jgi:hypothetical protein
MVTLPVADVRVTVFCAPFVFLNVRLPIEHVEFGLNWAMFPGKWLKSTEIPAGMV